MAQQQLRLRVKEMLSERGWTVRQLSQQTNLSESYLTHIKNGTRRWNADVLTRLGVAFNVSTKGLFSEAKSRRAVRGFVKNVLIEQRHGGLEIWQRLRMVPITSDLPATADEYANQLYQVASGDFGKFAPIYNAPDKAAFCYKIPDNSYAPTFTKGDLVLISPSVLTNSGDVVAIEYVCNDKKIRLLARVTYTSRYIMLLPLGKKQEPVTLIRGKNDIRIIGKVVTRYQKL